MATAKAVWTPQPGPQAEAIAATWCNELFYGGARGGGKSDFLLGDYLQDVFKYGQHWQGILLRKSYKELEQLIARSHVLYPASGAKWLESKHWWVWPNGARLKLRHLERESDADDYQGHEYPWIGFDELTKWPDLTSYKKLKACNRYTAIEIPTKRIRSAGNPGGPGHHAVKAYFIDYAPKGFTPLRDAITNMFRMFIPARVQDNKILMHVDPGYVDRLRGVGSPQLVKAWLEGDWNVVTGAYFPEFGDAHIIDPFTIPKEWIRFRSMDYGSARPFSVGWWAVCQGGDYPKGALIRYREWYGASGPNQGIKMPIAEIAKGILSRKSMYETIAYSVADPSIFKTEGGPSIAETFARNGVTWRPADNSRIAGWKQFRDRLIGEDDRPMVYFFSTCVDAIRTIPILQHDEKDPEDLDTEGEDHVADEARYGCMSRPYTRPEPKPVKPVLGMDTMSMDDLWKLEKRYGGRGL